MSKNELNKSILLRFTRATPAYNVRNSAWIKTTVCCIYCICHKGGRQHLKKKEKKGGQHRVLSTRTCAVLDMSIQICICALLYYIYCHACFLFLLYVCLIEDLKVQYVLFVLLCIVFK